MSGRKNKTRQLKELLDNRILVLDGAMGTMIQSYNLSETDFRGQRFKDHPGDLKGNYDLLSLTQPEIIKDIHLAFLEAGADIITTNSFTATAVSQADYRTENLVHELNETAAQIARKAVEEIEKNTRINHDSQQAHWVPLTAPCPYHRMSIIPVIAISLSMKWQRHILMQ
jgi:5-methyltetrahydrofolate--homocysteine methyltransferase